MLKRKWSTIILRHLEKGLNDPAEITKQEPGLSAKVLSERLRTMLRYDLVARFPRPSPGGIVEYRLTLFGKKILEMLNAIDQLDQRPFPRRSFSEEIPSPAPVVDAPLSDSAKLHRQS